jgi:hypothetical protein
MSNMLLFDGIAIELGEDLSKQQVLRRIEIFKQFVMLRLEERTAVSPALAEQTEGSPRHTETLQ